MNILCLIKGHNTKRVSDKVHHEDEHGCVTWEIIEVCQRCYQCRIIHEWHDGFKIRLIEPNKLASAAFTKAFKERIDLLINKALREIQ